MSPVTVSLDPGLRSPALALTVDRVLRACGRIRVPAATHKLPLVDRVLEVALLCLDWCACQNAHPTTVVFEFPQIYRASKSKGDPNDLPPLAAIGAAFAMAWRVYDRGVRVLAPLPREWCGQLPKATTGDARQSPRGHALVSVLASEELALLTGQHDETDAAAIAMWEAGRFPPRRLASGATPG